MNGRKFEVKAQAGSELESTDLENNKNRKGKVGNNLGTTKRSRSEINLTSESESAGGESSDSDDLSVPNVPFLGNIIDKILYKKFYLFGYLFGF